MDSLLGVRSMFGGVGVALDDSDGARGAHRQSTDVGAEDLMAQRVARLTPAQLDCLRLVDRLLSSKEIAAELHISPHTVDQRIRQALAIQNSRWPTLISFRGLLLVANGSCREDQGKSGLCSVRKPAPPVPPARSACRI